MNIEEVARHPNSSGLAQGTIGPALGCCPAHTDRARPTRPLASVRLAFSQRPQVSREICSPKTLRTLGLSRRAADIRPDDIDEASSGRVEFSLLATEAKPKGSRICDGYAERA